jgi:hypothetical protein
MKGIPWNEYKISTNELMTIPESMGITWHIIKLLMIFG